MANENFENEVSEMKDAVKDGRWNDISSRVWGDAEAQKALSRAVRTGQAEGLPEAHFQKDEKGLYIEFDRPGVGGWLKDRMSGKVQIRL